MRQSDDLKRELKSVLDSKQESKRKGVRSAHRNIINPPLHKSQLSRLSDFDREKSTKLDQSTDHLKTNAEIIGMQKEIVSLKAELEVVRKELSQ